MKKLRTWVKKEMPLSSLIWVIPLFTVGKLMYMIITVWFIKHFVSDPQRGFCSNTGKPEVLKKEPFIEITIFGYAGIEEFIFRFLPLVIIQMTLLFFIRKETVRFFCLTLSIITVSILFGYVHGNYLNIFVQGVAGVALSFLFLKYGGYIEYKNSDFADSEIKGNPFKGFIISTLAHGLFNLTIIKLT